MVKITELRIAIFVLSILVISSMFVMGAHLVATNTTTILEDTSTLINISVNNTDAALTANITGVKIIIPTSFVVFNDTANTSVSSVANFSYTSEGLNWTGEGLIRNLTNNIYFWFNISQATPGSYNITVNTTNSSSTLSFNISMVINDTTKPSNINFVLPATDGVNTTINSLGVNISAVDNGVLSQIVIRLYNSSGNNVNITNGSATAGSYFVNFTNLAEGKYYINATVNDTFGNFNDSITRTTTLDSTKPLVSYNPNTQNGTLNISNSIFVNVSITEANANTIMFNLYNRSGLIRQTNYTITNITTNNTINWTGLYLGNYTFNVSILDYAGNINTTSLGSANVSIDLVPPTVTFVNPEDGDDLSDSDYELEFELSEVGDCRYSFNGGDDNETMTSSDDLTFTHSMSGQDDDDYTVYANCEDNAGNKVSQHIHFTIDTSSDSGDDGDGGSGGSGDSNTVTWSSTYSYSDKELVEKGEFKKSLKEKERIKMKINGESHYLGVIDITSKKAVINISSTPQQATLLIGESTKFDVDSDNYYDLKVTLDSINSSIANFTVTPVHEIAINLDSIMLKTNSSVSNQSANSSVSTLEEKSDFTFNVSKTTWWIIGISIVLVVLIIVVLFIIFRKKSHPPHLRKRQF